MKGLRPRRPVQMTTRMTVKGKPCSADRYTNREELPGLRCCVVSLKCEVVPAFCDAHARTEALRRLPTLSYVCELCTAQDQRTMAVVCDCRARHI
nr:hypothetical protein CFP56_04546 [Quercus suber]